MEPSREHVRVKMSIRLRVQRGYTLIEMLIALIMFALISTATAFLITSAVRAYSRMGDESVETQEARAILATLTRDLRSTFVVTGSPSTYFVATGADSGPVLQFTALASRLAPDAADAAGAYETSTVMPQSDVLQITYYYDPSTRVLSRLVSSLPDTSTIPEPGGPEYILSRRVALLSFMFEDGSGNVRSDWNFQNAAATEGTPADAGTYDTTLPARIVVEVEIDRGNGQTVVLRTAVVPANATPQPAGQTPPAPQTPAGGGGAGGGGGTPPDGGGGSGAAPGGGGGAP